MMKLCLTSCHLRQFSVKSLSFSSASPSKSRGTVGFIGLGNMGASMAKNLLDSNLDLLVYDLNPLALKSAESQGAKIAPSLSSLINCSTIITMLPSSLHVSSTIDTLLNEGWSESATPQPKILIDSSTIDPLVSKSLALKLSNKNISMLDAPVSGGVVAAANGTLTFMVGGEIEILDISKLYLNAMGANIIHTGTNGSGSTAKICNNLAMAIQMISVSTSLNLGLKLGLDPHVLAKVMNSSTSRCWSSDSYNPYPGITPNSPSNFKYEGGFGVGLMLKDLKLAVAAAEEVGFGEGCKIGREVRDVYQEVADEGFEMKDFSYIYKHLEEIDKGDKKK